jgi:hemolysin activation/secretion protein
MTSKIKTLLLVLISVVMLLPTFARAAQAPLLKRLIFADNEELALAQGDQTDETAIVVRGIPLLNTSAFSAKMEPFIGQAITNDSINAIAVAVHEYIKTMDRLILNVRIPKAQDPKTGELRMVITLGRYKDLIFQGNKYFSSSLLQEKMGIHPGDEVRISTLDEAINWTNNNPFRRVKVFINDLKASDPGKADLVVAVQDVMPIKLGVSYDNSGVDILGENHYSASVQYGNLWGLDHIVTYQFTTTDSIRLYQVHSLDYRVPLPWRHYLQFQGAYALVHPTFGDGDFKQRGESIVSDLRYLIPVQFKGMTFEFSAGIDFKQSNNNLEFGGMEAGYSKTNVYQGTLGVTAIRRDSWGAWSAGLVMNYSPGNIDNKNTDEAFGLARKMSKARYTTGILSVQRLLDLPLKSQLVISGTVQRASQNLIGSEQMTIGGTGTVRGYKERIQAGDQGYVLNTELHGPLFYTSIAKLFPKVGAPLETRPIAFFDWGHVAYRNLTGNKDNDLDQPALASAGIGLRCSLGYRLNCSFDYGWQLRNLQMPNSGRGSLRFSLAY